MEIRFLIWGTLALAIGYILVAYFWRRSSDHEDKRRKGTLFESSFGPIFYSRRGTKKGPSLILLHGIGASGFSWRKLSPVLETDFDVINIDLWGFGRSHKDIESPATLETHTAILLELLKYLKVKQAHYVAGSMGGSIALWLSYKHPEMVNKLVTLAPAVHYALVPKITGRFRWLAKLTPMMINQTMIHTILNRVYANREAIDSEAIEEYLRPYLDSKAHQTFSNHLELIKDRRVFDILPEIQVPTLTLWGAKDAMVSQRAMEEVIPRLPSTIYSVHPRGGHHLMEEYPEWCAEQILPFLKSEE